MIGTPATTRAPAAGCAWSSWAAADPGTSPSAAACAEFGRHVAIVESPNGPHVVASLMRDGMWRVAEMDLRGRLLRR